MEFIGIQLYSIHMFCADGPPSRFRENTSSSDGSHNRNENIARFECELLKFRVFFFGNSAFPPQFEAGIVDIVDPDREHRTVWNEVVIVEMAAEGAALQGTLFIP